MVQFSETLYPNLYPQPPVCGGCTSSNASPVFPQATYDNFLNKSLELVQNIRGVYQPEQWKVKPSDHIGRVKIKNVHIGNNYTGLFVNAFNQTNHTVNYGGQHREEKEDKNVLLRVIVGIIGTVVAGVGLFKLGQDVSHLKQTAEEYEEIDTFNSQLNRDIGTLGKTPLLEKYEQLVHLDKKVFNEFRRNAMIDIAALVTIVVGAVFAVVGAIFGGTALMGVGVCLALLGAGVKLFMWGMNSTDKTLIKTANEIDHLAYKLKYPVDPSNNPPPYNPNFQDSQYTDWTSFQ